MDPVAVFGQLGLVGAQFLGEVRFFHSACQQDIPVAVPIGKGIIVTGGEAGGTEHETALGSHQAFQGADDLGRRLSGGLHGALDNPQLGLLAFPRPQAEKSGFDHIERGVRCVDPDFLISG